MKRPDTVREESKAGRSLLLSISEKGTEEGPIGTYLTVREQEIHKYIHNKTMLDPGSPHWTRS